MKKIQGRHRRFWFFVNSTLHRKTVGAYSFYSWIQGRESSHLKQRWFFVNPNHLKKRLGEYSIFSSILICFLWIENGDDWKKSWPVKQLQAVQILTKFQLFFRKYYKRMALQGKWNYQKLNSNETTHGLWTICRGEDFFGRRNRSFDSSLRWRPMKLFCKVLYIFALRLPDIGGASKSSDFYVLT